MTEYEDWYMSMAFIITDFVVNGGGSYDSTVLELVKFAVQRVESEINKKETEYGERSQKSEEEK